VRQSAKIEDQQKAGLSVKAVGYDMDFDKGSTAYPAVSHSAHMHMEIESARKPHI
jgi:hypothetical protein